MAEYRELEAAIIASDEASEKILHFDRQNYISGYADGMREKKNWTDTDMQNCWDAARSGKTTFYDWRINQKEIKGL
jgi:hypothetical protein